MIQFDSAPLLGSDGRTCNTYSQTVPKSERGISPLRVGEEVEVLRMADEGECLREMFGVIRWRDREFGVPLSQLEGLIVGEETQQALEDWHHWSEEEYEL